MISLQTLIILVVLFLGMAGIIIFAFSSQIKNLKNELSGKDKENILMEWLKEMRGTVEKNSETLERQLSTQREVMEKQTRSISERLENSSQVIQQVHRELGGITEFGKDMKDLSNILKSPKLRGGLGEQFLYEILENSLPKELFKTQYKFKDGNVCDAIVKTSKGLIAIDSKFPMENFKAMLTEENQDGRDRFKKLFIKDVKTRIDEISSKYILIDEGTTDFAVMYVPSENIYYELIVNSPEIEEFSRNKKVFITSPNTLNYMMKAILVAYQQNELQKHAGEILNALGGIKAEAQKFNEDLDLLSRHIVNGYKTMDNVKIKFTRLFGKIESAQAIGGEEEKPLLPETTEETPLE
ncbi:hypothetical protein A2V49_00625 [candidate division WWE3 bacterium RBG_19FT_COMBO_34_6]|uniref:DNA recombination protein RmuC n=1 Tax=candidate division WWE3 bacterium RBG_19FT_COMBO_34_6 TaxID=1802612 RepID=A0A1F4UNQ5_UNCKA|nr:MAG: hypothetical protein A2V49_00625 [candidate division WWE3 bacterium RBG_19FT_COMBO_34_6]